MCLDVGGADCACGRGTGAFTGEFIDSPPHRLGFIALANFHAAEPASIVSSNSSPYFFGQGCSLLSAVFMH